MTCRTREYLCARERIRDLHDWRSFAGLNSLCDICLLCLRPLLCSCLSLSFIPLFLDLFSSLSFFPINEDVKLVPFLWRPAMTEQIRNRKRKRARRRRNLTSSTLKKRLHHFLSNQQLLQTENFRSRTWEGLFVNVCVLEAQRRFIIGSALPKDTALNLRSHQQI